MMTQQEIILHSEEGVARMQKDYSSLKTHLDNYRLLWYNFNPELNCRVVENRHGEGGFNIIVNGHTLSFQFFRRYRNATTDSMLSIQLFKGLFGNDGYADIFHPVTLIKVQRYQFNLDENMQVGWSDLETNEGFETFPNLVRKWCDLLFNEAIKE
jgi:hypothetical protein